MQDILTKIVRGGKENSANSTQERKRPDSWRATCTRCLSIPFEPCLALALPCACSPHQTIITSSLLLPLPSPSPSPRRPPPRTTGILPLPPSHRPELGGRRLRLCSAAPRFLPLLFLH